VLAHGPGPANGPVVVVGGAEPHLEPFVVTEALLATGQPVTLLTEHVAPGPAIEPRTLNYYLGRLLRAGVAVVPMTRAVAWRGGVLRTVNLYSGVETEYAAAAVVVTRERRAADSLAAEVRQAVADRVAVHVIGDALAPRRMTHAALEGARIGTAV
jgi:2,4-dienoyl-CoA reductase (NADPH2)